MNGYIAAVSTLFEDASLVTTDLGRSESSALKLGLALKDPDFAHGLANAKIDAEDIFLMSGWSWILYLQWRSTLADAPSTEFLNALFATSDDPAFRISMVSALLEFRNLDQGYGITDNESWLAQRLSAFVQPRDSERTISSDVEIGFELVDYLLEIGTEQSLAIFGRLLRHSWGGRDQLIGLAFDRIGGIAADDQSRVRFLRSVGLPGDELSIEMERRNDRREGDIP